jgi:hypothetical protein
MDCPFELTDRRIEPCQAWPFEKGIVQLAMEGHCAEFTKRRLNAKRAQKKELDVYDLIDSLNLPTSHTRNGRNASRTPSSPRCNSRNGAVYHTSF